MFSRVAPNNEMNESGLLFFSSRKSISAEDRAEIIRLVVPELLQRDFLHHYHRSLEGGHQGIGISYQRIRANFHSKILYRSVQRYVGKCLDCKTVKGMPSISGKSPGNVHATYPFQKNDRDGS